MTKDVNGGMNKINDGSNELLIMQQIVLVRTFQNRPGISPREDCVAIFLDIVDSPVILISLLVS